jgi:hypothetical protein
MSLDAIRIVREVIARRKESIPDVHCAHARLDTLEADIVDRISKELVELSEGFMEKFSSRVAEDVPKCQYCPMTAVYEGWANKADPFTGQPGSMCQRIFVCGEHRNQLKGAENHG